MDPAPKQKPHMTSADKARIQQLEAALKERDALIVRAHNRLLHCRDSAAYAASHRALDPIVRDMQDMIRQNGRK